MIEPLAHRMRRLLPVLLAISLSCSSGSQTCNSSTCQGCCDESGECHAGTGLFECGAGGAMCVACAANQVCAAGACGLFDGGEYDASFPMTMDASYNLDAGVYDAGRDAGQGDAGPVDAGRPDAGADAGRPDGGSDAGRPDAGFDAGRPDAGSDAGADAGDGG